MKGQRHPGVGIKITDMESGNDHDRKTTRKR